jgi:peptidoglycan/LPS O-acetylase OafA/YrhL
LIVDPSSESRLRGIHGLRAIAAGSILVGHVWAFAPPDRHEVNLGPFNALTSQLPLGVTLFFLLSAFLLYRPFAKAVLRGKPLPGITKYLRNRTLRILPAYWFILVVTGLVLQSTNVRGPNSKLVPGALDDPLPFMTNAAFLQSFHPNTIITGIGPAWSLVTEVIFYLVLPLLGLMAWRLGARASTRRGRRLAALAPAAALFALGLSGKAVAAFVVPGEPWAASWHAVIERSFWAHADFFAFGLVVAVLHVDVEDGALKLAAWTGKAAVAAFVVLGMATAKFTTPEGLADGSVSNYAYDTLMAGVLALLLALVVLPSQKRPTILVRVLETRFLVAAGVVSYSIFLWQVPVILWARDHGLTLAGPPGVVVNLAVLGTIMFVLSVFSYRYVEYPALIRKGKAKRAHGVEAPTAAPSPS